MRRFDRGKDGAILFPESTEGLADRIGTSTPLTVETIESGHFPQREQPDRIAVLITQFVTRNLAVAGRTQD